MNNLELKWKLERMEIQSELRNAKNAIAAFEYDHAVKANGYAGYW